MEKGDLESLKKSSCHFFRHFFYRITAHATLAMTEPAKDTAIDIAPKTQPTQGQGRVPKIVAEINRVASRVRDRNKKDDDRDDEVLENDGPTDITRIVRENTCLVKERPQVCLAHISSRLVLLYHKLQEDEYHGGFVHPKRKV